MRQTIALLTAILVASAMPAADWPNFRGPNRDDNSPDKGLLKEWSAEGPELAFKATGLGIGFSSVAVVGDKIYTMGDVGPESFVFALDRKTGKNLWKTKVGKSGGNYAGPRCTPSVAGDRVFALGQFGDFVSLDAADGTEKWRKNLATDFGGRAGGWNYTESPLIDGENVVVTPGGPKASIVSFKQSDGEVNWKAVVPGGSAAGYSSIAVGEIGGVKQYVQLMANSLVGVAAKDGKFLWQYGNTNQRFAGNTANIPTPIIKGDMVFSSAGYGRGAALVKLSESGGKFTAEEVYWKPELKNKHGGVVMVGDRLYGDFDDSGFPWCADFESGKVLFKRDDRTKGSGSASMTFADGMLYVRYQNGWVSLVDPSKSYDEVSTFKVPNGNGNCWAHPVVIDGKFYVREKDTLWVYDVKAK